MNTHNAHTVTIVGEWYRLGTTRGEVNQIRRVMREKAMRLPGGSLDATCRSEPMDGVPGKLGGTFTFTIRLSGHAPWNTHSRMNPDLYIAKRLLEVLMRQAMCRGPKLYDVRVKHSRSLAYSADGAWEVVL